jgi:hypothetical protein
MINIVRTELWQPIVAATEDLGPDATSLRIPLWVEFREPPRKWKRSVVAIWGIFLRVMTFRHKRNVPPARGRVLFCLPHRTPSNVNNFLPVAREAHNRSVLGGIFTAQNLSQELKEFAGNTPVLSAEELVSQLGLLERWKIAVRAAKSYKQLSAALIKHVPKIGMTGRRLAVFRMVLDSLFYGAVCRQVLDSWSPNCVFSTSDFWPFEHQLCRQASLRGIPSAIIQHGTIDYIWWPFVADFYYMWGEAHVEQMLHIDAPAERMKAVGMPATDRFFLRAENAQPKAVSKEAPVCLLLSMTNGISAEPEIFRNYREFLMEAIRLIPSITWKVKFHPVEDDSFYRGMGDEIYSRLKFHPRDLSLEQAVNDADIVTTVYSTAGMEAMVMNKPVIIAPATPRVHELAWWPSMGGGTYAVSAQDFQAQVTKLISDQEYRTRQITEQRHFLSKSFANQGHAAERIVDMLEQYSSHPQSSNTRLGTADRIEKSLVLPSVR